METIITKSQVADAVGAAIPQLACVLPHDIAAGLSAARACESDPRGAFALGQLVENARIAAADRVPICQDTGTVWVCLEVGPDVCLPGDVFADVDAAVARAYGKARLRKSVVRDALFDRANTGDNTPAFCEVRFADEPGTARVHVMLKGGGSDNASRVVMLPPGAGRAGVVDEVVRCVREKGANACPPLVVGVGVGATFDKVAGLAKRALMRPADEPAADPQLRAFEEELLDAVNATGVGPNGLGGAATALAVRVATAPCHIAALPVAINMGCSAMRRVTIDLAGRYPDQDAAFGCHPDRAERAEGSRAASAESAPEPVRLSLPLDRVRLGNLKAGDACLLTGPLFTLRDAGHVRLLAELEEAGGQLPYGLDGQAIFYAGPTPEAAGRPFGAIGPTTASRMDFAAPTLYRAGIAATIGKGRRSQEVREACMQTGSVYFVACGGAAAFLAKCVESSETLGYDDLGTEALRRIDVVDFPVFVGIDAQGRDIYER